MQQKIEKILTADFQPTHLEVINESHQHNVPKGSESHFKVIIVSEQLTDLSQVKRHQRIYQALSDIMHQIHALSLHTYTPQEWRQHTTVPSSPLCKGGSKKN